VFDACVVIQGGLQDSAEVQNWRRVQHSRAYR